MNWTRRGRRARWLLAMALAATGLTETGAAERMVLVEKFSATWCPHCATSSQVLDDLIQQYPTEFVTFDAFSATDGRYWTDWGVDRAFDFYGLGGPGSGYPRVVFDGVSFYDGATDIASIYEEAITQRAAVPTDVSIQIVAEPIGGGIYDLTTSVTMDADGEAKDMRIYLARALDDYGVYDDAAETVPHNTIMSMVETGQDVSLAPGETVQLTRSFGLEADSWRQFEDVRLIAWAQEPNDLAAAEVFNAGQALLYQANPADYDGDGFVGNLGDGELFDEQFGAAVAPFSGADGTGDGFVDGADRIFMQRLHGMTSNRPSSAGVGAVPEPSTLLLGLLSLACACRTLRRCGE